MHCACTTTSQRFLKEETSGARSSIYHLLAESRRGSTSLSETAAQMLPFGDAPRRVLALRGAARLGERRRPRRPVTFVTVAPSYKTKATPSSLPPLSSPSCSRPSSPIPHPRSPCHPISPCLADPRRSADPSPPALTTRKPLASALLYAEIRPGTITLDPPLRGVREERAVSTPVRLPLVTNQLDRGSTSFDAIRRVLSPHFCSPVLNPGDSSN